MRVLPSNLRHLRTLNLSGLAVTAQVQPDGKLLPIKGAFDKLLAAAREKSLPRLHTVIVAEYQPLAAFNLARDDHNQHLLKDPHADFHVLRAGTLEEAATLLSVDAQTRWGSIDCSLPPPDPAFVGRERLMKAVQDFIATHDAGYLVILSGMGKGKSAFLAALVHAALMRGQEPIYHFIGYHPSGTGKSRNIAACLYSRLRRKYAFPEPEAWGALDIEDRLEQLLKSISEIGALDKQGPEVLYLDAADQVEMNATEPFLSAALRTLPRGVLGVITSRLPLEWLNTSQSVTIWEMDDYTDDREDVQAYLRQQGSQLLSPDFIEQIIAHPDPPVFFTITQRLRQLSDPTQPAPHKAELSADPGLWVMPSQELIQTEAQRMLARANHLGLSEGKVWQTLGLLAIGREELSEDLLSELDLWEGETSERILKLAANFFDRRPPLRRPTLPYKFEHPGYHSEVLSHLTQREKLNCHRLIAVGCLHWKRLEGEAQRYALCHGPYHLREARHWDELERLLSDREFINVRCAADLIFETIADIAVAFQAPITWEHVFAAVIESIHVQASERSWLQWRSALVKFFGVYATWPTQLQTALKESTDPQLMRFLAETYDMEGQHAQAASLLEQLVKLADRSDFVSYSRTSIRLATVYSHQKKYSDALRILTDLLSHPEMGQSAGLTYGWAQYHYGITLRRLGQYAEAIRVLEDVYSAQAGSDLGLSALHQLGVVDLEEGRFVEAEKKFKTSLNGRSASEWNHRRAFDYSRLGEVYARTSLAAEARLAFDEAITISRRCGNQRYVSQVYDSIAEVLVTHHLRQEQPETIILADLARRFNIAPIHLPLTFRRLAVEGLDYLEIVDEVSSQPTGQVTTREVAHREGWWHASVAVIVTNPLGQCVAWQQRGESDSRGKWDVSIAGHLAVGETDSAAAIREGAEELGIQINPARLRRVGHVGEFRKVGSPEIVQDEHESPTSYRYHTPKKNSERVSVFVLNLTEEEQAQMALSSRNDALAVKWTSLTEATQAIQAQPQQFASSFKHLFGHPSTLERLARAVSEANSTKDS